MKTIYTTGYQFIGLDRLEAQREKLSAMIVDVRKAAYSPNPAYLGASLLKRFGSMYVHLPEWGNENFKDHEAPIKIADFQRGYDFLFKGEKDLTYILMCACARPEACHRTVLALMLRSRGHVVAELLEEELNAQPNLF